jgi:hypothetical protein
MGGSMSPKDTLIINLLLFPGACLRNEEVMDRRFIVLLCGSEQLSGIPEA